jgi:hypothetical protein
MCTTIRLLTKSCRTCQVNKKRKLKYGHLPPKTVITVPWRVLCVDLIGPYTLKGKDGTIIDFTALTMIDPATSWFEVVELLLVHQLKTITVNGKENTSKIGPSDGDTNAANPTNGVPNSLSTAWTNTNGTDSKLVTNSKKNRTTPVR